MGRWRKKQVVVEAPHMLIPTPGGTLRAELADWIVRGVKGEVYPCKADVFAASYEPLR